MAFAQPSYVVAQVGQDVTVTTTIAADTTGWTATHELRTNIDGTLIASKTVGSGIVNTPGATSTMVTTFTAANLASLTPGAYVHRLERTSPSVFPIFDWSTFRLTADEASPQLTNLSDYCAFAGISETVTDADAKALLSYISGAETDIRDWCGRQFSFDTYTEYPVGTWNEKTMLIETPVITTDLDIRVDYTRGFAADTELTYDSDYFLDIDRPDGKSHNGILRRIGRVWEGYRLRPPGNLSYIRRPGRGMIKAVYQGGYTLTPDDLKVAIFQIVQQRLAVRGFGVALQSESGMNYAYSKGPYDEEARKIMSVEQVIWKYKRGDTLIG